MKKALCCVLLLALLSACAPANKVDYSIPTGPSPELQQPPNSDGYTPEEPSEPPDEPSPSQTPDDAPAGDGLVWAVEPALEYEVIYFFPALGYIGYKPDWSMFFIDEKTGGIIAETGATGGFGNPYQYGYDIETGAFYYYDEYEYYPERTSAVSARSMGTALAVHEVELTEWGYDYKNESKYAVVLNGEFITGFVFDWAIGGNPVALVLENGMFGILSGEGKMNTGFIYDGVGSVAPGYVAAQIGNQWGFVEFNGKELIPFIFEDIEGIDETTAFVKYQGYYGILDVVQTVKGFS